MFPGRKEMTRFLIASLLLLLFCGCATWKSVEGSCASEPGGYHFNFSKGWMIRQDHVVSNVIVIRKNGSPLGRIYIEKRLYNEKEPEIYKKTELSVIRDSWPDLEKDPYLKQKIWNGMPPLDLAEFLIGRWKSSANPLNFDLLEISPVTVSGRSGAKVIFTLKTGYGGKLKVVIYAFVAGEKLYELTLCAPQRYYYDLYVNDFEKMVASFRLVDEAKR
jgi:hypothetical protein